MVLLTTLQKTQNKVLVFVSKLSLEFKHVLFAMLQQACLTPVILALTAGLIKVLSLNGSHSFLSTVVFCKETLCSLSYVFRFTHYIAYQTVKPAQYSIYIIYSICSIVSTVYTVSVVYTVKLLNIHGIAESQKSQSRN